MAKPNDPSNLDRLAEQIKAGLTEGVNSATAIDPTEAILSDSSPAVSAESTPPAETPTAAPSIPADLGAFVANLSPEQLAKVRSLAIARGISAGPQRGPGGGLLVTVEIPAEACEPLQTWADESGSTFAEFVSKVAGDAIVNYCFGDWGATVVTPAPVAAGAAGAAAAAPTTP